MSDELLKSWAADPNKYPAVENYPKIGEVNTISPREARRMTDYITEYETSTQRQLDNIEDKEGRLTNEATAELMTYATEHASQHPEFMGNAVKRWMVTNNYNIPTAARELGLSVQSLSRFCICRLPTTEEDVIRIANRYGITPDVIISLCNLPF